MRVYTDIINVYRLRSASPTVLGAGLDAEPEAAVPCAPAGRGALESGSGSGSSSGAAGSDSRAGAFGRSATVQNPESKE